MPVDFSGKWEYTHGENMLEFMEKFDPEMAERMKAHKGAPPKMSMEVEQTGDLIKSLMIRDGKSTEIVLTVGKESEHDLPNGRKMKGTAHWDGDKLAMSAVDEKGFHFEIVREIAGDDQIMTMKSQGITAKRFYKRV